MTEFGTQRAPSAAAATHPPPAARLARSVLLRRARAIDGDGIELREHFSGRSWVLGRGPARLSLEIEDPAFYRRVLCGGTLGAAEAFVDGLWHCRDLAALTTALARRPATLSRLDRGAVTLAAPLRRLRHALRRNSRAGSRANIAAHYDVGNDYFELLLDESMTYSCALFATADTTLHDAQTAKLERLCRLLRLRPTDHLLEIGTGWGSLAVHAAGRFGCRVTTITLSAAQHDLARRRVARAGLDHRVEVRLQDYRDVAGRYDKIVSVEMVEAVGHQYLPRFFACCDRLLAPGGSMAMQAITIRDRDYEAARQRVDFIKRHVFPGSFIPSVTALAQAATRGSRLRIHALRDFGPHYARTLRQWRDNLHTHRLALRARGYGERFLRAQEFYLAYCEGGFAAGKLGLAQILWQR